jgi:chromosome partitioning protein
MRVDGHRHATRRLRDWSDSVGLPLVSALRDTPAYVRCVEQGLTVFDMPAHHVQTDLQQWAPILEWLAPVLTPAPVAPSSAVASGAGAATAAPPRPLAAATRAASVPPRAFTSTQPLRDMPSLATLSGDADDPAHAGLGRMLRGLFDLRPKWRRTQHGLRG